MPGTPFSNDSERVFRKPFNTHDAMRFSNDSGREAHCLINSVTIMGEGLS